MISMFRGRRAALPVQIMVVGAIGTTLLLSADVAGQCTEYELTIIESPDCGFPWGTMPAVGTAINDEGVMTGQYWQCPPAEGSEMFIWTALDGLQTIERPPGMNNLEPSDINDAGQIVGWATFPGNGLGRQAFIWTEGRFTILDLIDGTNESEATGINGQGHVVGWWNDSLDGDPPQEAVLWVDGAAVALGPLLNEPSSVALDINDHGDIVGSQRTIGKTFKSAFLLSDGEAIELGSLPGQYSNEAIAVNNLRQVVVRSHIDTGSDGGNPYRSYLWEDGRVTDLGLAPGASETYGRDINDRGQIVGYSLGGPDGAAGFLWENGQIILLDAFVSSTAHIEVAWGINNVGQITGGADVDGLGSVAFVLTPIGPAGDMNGDCAVDPTDLAILLGNWGPCPIREGCRADLDSDDLVGPADLAVLLANWR